MVFSVLKTFDSSERRFLFQNKYGVISKLELNCSLLSFLKCCKKKNMKMKIKKQYYYYHHYTFNGGMKKGCRFNDIESHSRNTIGCQLTQF